MKLKTLWCFTYLNYPLLFKLFFYNWCNYLIFMYETSKCWEWIAVYNHEKNIQIFLKILLASEITLGVFFFFFFFFWNIRYNWAFFLMSNWLIEQFSNVECDDPFLSIMSRMRAVNCFLLQTLALYFNFENFWIRRPCQLN